MKFGFCSLFFLPFALAARLGGKQAPPVSVKVYVESLCPGCQQFVTDELVPVYNELGESVIDLTLVPFGNAKIEDGEPFQVECQHGPAECDANSWEQCGIFASTTGGGLDFLACLDDALPAGHAGHNFDPSTFETCADTAGLDFGPIQDCHDDPDMSRTLQVIAAKLTPPEHKYVPWVVVDGKVLDGSEMGQLRKAICDAYGGTCGSADSTSIVSKMIEEPCAVA